MHQSPGQWLEADHRRLEALLQRALPETTPGHATDSAPETEAFMEFRKGLLRHIAIEERVLMPRLRADGRLGNDLFQRLRLDHGAVVALLVPPPTPGTIAAIRAVLTAHNVREEGEHGLYSFLSELGSDEAAALTDQMMGFSPVPLSAAIDNPDAYAPAARAMLRAGYDPVPFGLHPD